MSSLTRSTVVGVFAERTQAEAALAELRRIGFREDQLGVVARRGDADMAGTVEDKAGPTMGTGAGIGMLVGASVGCLVAGAGLIPILVGGVLTAALSGAVAGGLIGALIDLGIPEEEARFYQGELEAGRTLLLVRAADRAAEARDVLRRNGAERLRSAAD